jgi:hypothetical protein
MESIPLCIHYHHADLRLRILNVEWARSTKEQLSTIGETYPRSTLNYYHGSLDSKDPSPLIRMAPLVKMGARKDKTFVQKLTNDVDVQQGIIKACTAKSKEMESYSIPANVRFHPRDYGFYGEDFRRGCYKDGFTRTRLIPSLTRWVEDLVDPVKELYRYGF